jgi:hypothetical protein
MLKLIITLLSIISTFAYSEAKEIDSLPAPIIGTLTVDNMTEGQLLWMKGKVGEGKYLGIDQQGRHCSINVPVVIGHFSETRVGVHETNGFIIAITSRGLSEALLSGRPINNTDWVFREKAPSDGYIMSGIEPTEQFILNSRSRWISWFLDEKRTAVCS